MSVICNEITRNGLDLGTIIKLLQKQILSIKINLEEARKHYDVLFKAKFQGQCENVKTDNNFLGSTRHHLKDFKRFSRQEVIFGFLFTSSICYCFNSCVCLFIFHHMLK